MSPLVIGKIRLQKDDSDSFFSRNDKAVQLLASPDMGRQLFSRSTAFVIVTREIMVVLRVNLAPVFSPFSMRRLQQLFMFECRI